MAQGRAITEGQSEITSSRCCSRNLDNVKGRLRRMVGGNSRWNIALGPRAQLRIYHSRLLTDLARANPVILRPSQAIQKGREFSVSTIHDRTSTRSRDAGKSFPDKCAVLVLTASGTDRDGVSFSCQVAGAAISLAILLSRSRSLPFLFFNSHYEFRGDPTFRTGD